MTKLFLCILALAPVSALADATLPAIFGDNMVLQGPKAVVWGSAAPNETVTVKIGARSAKAAAGKEGKWTVTLQRLKTGGPYEMTVNSLTLHNVAVGEVWLCAGASNMAMPVNGAVDAEKEIAAAKFPMIRLFKEGKWGVCDPATVVDFSATAYFFGRDIHQRTKAPVGLIECAASSTPIEAWLSATALMAHFQPLLDKWKTEMDAYPQAKEVYGQLYATWKQQVEQAKAASQPAPPPPRRPKAPDDPAAPALAYDKLIAPLIPFTLKGVLWYQGEANVGDPKQYGALFTALIQSWRGAWGEGDFPFVFAQLANFLPRSEEPSESLWAELREAQAAALKLPETRMAVAIDIGDEHSLLPKNKQEIGRRLALAAADTQGPRFAGMKIVNGKARLSFVGTGGGLVAKGALKGFAIAGGDRRFVVADAKIEKGKVIVWSDKVPNPAAVRYAWANTPECALYNKENLPAAPFRTDNWAQAE